ncbi:MAG: tetratricopeptide repeat protein [Ignavibacteria bacterium]|nr:tetratricopeptide repeat protein [Ignavibacteria bacterium]
MTYNKMIVFLIVLLSLQISGQDKVVLGEYRSIQSTIYNAPVTYLVHLPDGYEQSGKEYPVVYILNGDNVSNFANAAATLDNLSVERIPNFILIGIPAGNPFNNIIACPDRPGGLEKAEQFGNFLQNELLPEVKKQFRTNDYRILFGQSNCGLLTLNILLRHNELFTNYVIASPMLNWCGDYYFRLIENSVTNTEWLHKKVYVAYGQLDYEEVLGRIHEFESVIMNLSMPTSTWKFEMVNNDGHVPYLTLHNALLYFFSECTISKDKRAWSVDSLKKHFENLSRELGFTITPQSGVIFDLAMEMGGQKNYERAISLFNYLITIEKKNAFYFYGFGLTCYQMGNLKAAEEYLEKCLKIDPGMNRAKSLLEKMKAATNTQ